MPRIPPSAPDPRRHDPLRRPGGRAPAGPDTTTTREGTFIHTRPNNHQAAPGQRPLRNLDFRAWQPPAPVPAPARGEAARPDASALGPAEASRPDAMAPARHSPDALAGAALLLSLAGSPGGPLPEGPRPRLTLDTALADRFRGHTGDTTVTAPPSSAPASHRTIDTALPASAATDAPPPSLASPRPGLTPDTVSPASVATPWQGSIFGASVADSRRPSPLGSPRDELPPLSPFPLGPFRLDGPAFDSVSPPTPQRAALSPRNPSPGTAYHSPFDETR